MNRWLRMRAVAKIGTVRRSVIGIMVVAMVVAMAVTIATTVAAEVPNRSPEQLRETATHVVVGEVAAIYSRESREGSWKYTRYVAEIRVKSIEKGEGLQADRVIFARYFQRAYRGPGRIADTAGHRMLAKEGKTLRVYLAQNASDGFNRDNNDGGYNVVFPNGFERLEHKPAADSR